MSVLSDFLGFFFFDGRLGLHNSSRHKPHIEIFDVIGRWDSSLGFLALAHNKPCENRCVQMPFCKSNENPAHKDASVSVGCVFCSYTSHYE